MIKCLNSSIRTAAAVLSAVILVTACGSTDPAGTSQASSAGSSNREHEALTMLTASRDFSKFEEALHEAYPEVNIEFISYRGADTTDYILAQLEAGSIPDIFVSTHTPPEELQEANLIDLSGEEFLSKINLKLLSDINIGGSIYLLPSNVSLFGPYYNRTLFEEHGWEVPETVTDIEALMPEIEAAGVKLAETTTQYPGSCFGFFFDITASTFCNTIEGVKWQRDFLSGNAKAAGNLESSVDMMQHWIDLGLLNMGETPTVDEKTYNRFKEGRTAFLVTNSNLKFQQNDDGSGDVYGLLPFLGTDSEDDSTIITQVSNYYGISKSLEKDPQKLEDAMKVMAFLATAEGQESLRTRENSISPLKDTELDKSSPLYEAARLVDKGQSMTLVYHGWEDYVVDFGTYVGEWIAGDITGQDFIAKLDELQEEVISTGSSETYGEATEDLDKEQTAMLVGKAFMQAADADCALISLGDFHGHNLENKYGVNGGLYAGVPVDAGVVCSINPLGWNNTIKTLTLTGRQIKDIAAEGYYTDEDPEAFPYVLVTGEVTELADDEVYTVACVIESDERAALGSMSDTGIKGQDVLTEYIRQLGVLSSKTIGEQ